MSRCHEVSFFSPFRMLGFLLNMKYNDNKLPNRPLAGPKNRPNDSVVWQQTRFYHNNVYGYLRCIFLSNHSLSTAPIATLHTHTTLRLITLQTQQLSYKHNINIENLRLRYKGTTRQVHVDTIFFHLQPDRVAHKAVDAHQVKREIQEMSQMRHGVLQTVVDIDMYSICMNL